MEKTKKEKKWRIELTEHQLMLMAQCVEDCHRFMAGQMELSNSTACLKHTHDLWDKLNELQPLVTPELGRGASYGWNGGTCPNDNQRKFLAETYYLYRRIYEATTKERAKTEDFTFGNVYLGETLRCKDSGEPITISLLSDQAK